MTIEAYRDWLIKNGATILKPTNQWEVLRFKTCDGLGIIYKNSKDALKYTGEAEILLNAFNSNKSIPLAVNKTKRSKLERSLVDLLVSRDGWRCFYCDEILDYETCTREHLLPVSYGGPDHINNIVLSCEYCNRKADRLSLIEKIKLRESIVYYRDYYDH